MTHSEKSDYISTKTLAGIGIGLVLFFLLTVLFIYRGALSTARSAACGSNMNALGHAMASYAEDHNGLYPPGDTWNDALKAYHINEANLRCPAAKGNLPTYAMNAALVGRSTKSIKDPEKTVLLFESVTGRNLAGGPELLPAAPRHNSNAVLFANGDVRLYSIEYIRELMVWGE